MLQIISWIGCVLLVLCGLRLLQEGLKSEEGSTARTIGFLGLVIGIVAGIGFLILVQKQAEYMEYAGSEGTARYQDSLSAAERSSLQLTPRQREIRDEILRNDTPPEEEYPEEEY